MNKMKLLCKMNYHVRVIKNLKGRNLNKYARYCRQVMQKQYVGLPKLQRWQANYLMNKMNLKAIQYQKRYNKLYNMSVTLWVYVSIIILKKLQGEKCF